MDQLDPSYESIAIFADRHKMSQAFRNIFSNALKFTPENGKITVLVEIIAFEYFSRGI